MDSINVWNTPLVANKLEVDKVDHWPHLPGSLAGSQKIIIDLASDGRQGISIDKAEVCEEDAHEDRAPEELINGNLGEDWDGICSRDLLIQPVVEVMSRGAMVDESEEGEGGEAFVVDGSTSNEELKVEIEKRRIGVERDQ